MIDHLTIRVKDVQRSRDFFRAALAPLGYDLLREMDIPGVGLLCGFGEKGKPVLWITTGTPDHPVPIGGHVAFSARRRADVNAFHAAALAAGARDDGQPGPRPIYHQNYYGAFVIDENDVHLEACCHLVE